MAPSLRLAAALVLLAATHAAGARQVLGYDAVCKVTNLDTYPGYEGSYKVEGYRIKFKVVNDDKDMLKAVGQLELSGAPADAVGGFHIHEGESCASHDDVMGHLIGDEYDKYPATDDRLPGDPWFADYGAVYKLEKRTPEIKYSVFGFDMDDIDGRTVVLHEPSGDRFACGILTCRSLA